MPYFWGQWYPCFGFLMTSPLSFKARMGCLIRIAEANAVYIPGDQPLVLNIANLLMVSIVGQQFKTTVQHRHLPAHSI